MLRLPAFERYEPTTVEDAVGLLDALGSDALVVGGGTDLLPKVKRGQRRPAALVSLSAIEGLDGVAVDADGARIGGLTRLATVAGHEELRQAYPAVAEAAGAAGTPTLRRMGTLAGNLCQDTRCRYYDQTAGWRAALGYCLKAPGPAGFVPDPSGGDTDAGDDGDDGEEAVPCRVAPGSPRCWAVFAADTAPALVALGASVTLVGPDGPRDLPLADLYRDDGVAHLAKDPAELLVEVRLPAADGVRSTYRKHARRGSVDFPEVGVAVAVRQAADGTVEAATVALGGVASRPVVAAEAAAALVGERPTPERLEAAGEAAAAAGQPMDNTALHPSVRRRVAAVATRRALASVVE